MSGLALGQLPEVVIEHGGVDLPSGSQAHVGNGVFDDELAKRWPGDADVLGCLLAGEPHGWGWPGEPLVERCACALPAGRKRAVACGSC